MLQRNIFKHKCYSKKSTNIMVYREKCNNVTVTQDKLIFFKIKKINIYSKQV